MRTLPYLALTLALAAGCAGRRQGLELNSTQTADRLATDPTSRSYTASDRNTADFFLSDLPPAAKDADLAGLIGSSVLWVEEIRKWFARRAVDR